MADKKIKLIQFDQIEKFSESGIFHNSKEIKYDAFIFATGYKGQNYMVEKYFGIEVSKKIGQIWNFNQRARIK